MTHIYNSILKLRPFVKMNVKSALTLRKSVPYDDTFPHMHLTRRHKKARANFVRASFWRRHPDLNRRIGDLQSPALPLGYGAIVSLFLLRASRSENCHFLTHRSVSKIAAVRGYLQQFWSGQRDSNSLPPPWQGGALPNELCPQNGASGRSRTGDTRIFSPLLYQLSYRGIFTPAAGGVVVGTTGLEPVTPCL